MPQTVLLQTGTTAAGLAGTGLAMAMTSDSHGAVRVLTSVFSALICVTAFAVGVSCGLWLQLRHHTCCWESAAAGASSSPQTSDPAQAAVAAATASFSAWQRLQLLQQHVRLCSCVQLWCQLACGQHSQVDRVLVAWSACHTGMSAVACVTCWYIKVLMSSDELQTAWHEVQLTSG